MRHRVEAERAARAPDPGASQGSGCGGQGRTRGHRQAARGGATTRGCADAGGLTTKRAVGVRVGSLRRAALALSFLAASAALGCVSYVGQLKPATPQVDSYHKKGMAALAQDRPADAVKAFELALKLQPLYVPSKAHLGYARYKLHQYDRAIQELDDTVESQPDYADTYNYLGLVYEAKGAPARAEQSYSTAIDTYPTYADAYYNRAMLREKQSRLGDALDDFKTAATIAAGGADPASKIMVARANTAAGLIYMRNGIRKDARQHFQIAVDTGDTIPEARYGIGRLEELDEHWVDAIVAYHEALKVKLAGWVRKPDRNACKAALARVHKRSPNRVAKQLIEICRESYNKLKGMEKSQRAKAAPAVYDQVRRLLYSAGKINPRSVEKRVFNGRLHLEKGDINRAGREVQAALKIDKKDQDARFLLAAIYHARATKRLAKREKGVGVDLKKAERILRALRRESPEVLRYHNLLGVTYFREEQLRRAEREWREALRCEGAEATKKQVTENLQALLKKPVIKKANALNGAGMTALKGKRFDEARSLFKQALSFDPLFATAHANLARTELEANRLDEAKKEIGRSLKLDPDLHTGYVIRARYEMRRKRYKSAGAALAEALRLNAFDPEVHYQRARLAWARKDLNAAFRALQRALAVDPDHTPSHVLLARVHLARNEKGKAEIQLQLAISTSDGKYVPALFALGDLYNELGRYDEAIGAAEQASEKDPAAPEPWLVYARAMEGKREPRRAGFGYLEAAKAFDGKGQFEDAVQYARRATKALPNDASAFDRLGLFVAKTGQYPEAIRHFRHALQLDAGFLLARFDLATVYEQAGHRDLAAEAYRAVVKAKGSIEDKDNAKEVEAYWLPRFRLASLYEPGKVGPVKRSEAVRALEEAARVAPGDYRAVVQRKLREIE